MTFSAKVRKELVDNNNKSRCCKLAELGAYTILSKKYNKLKFVYEDYDLAKKVYDLIYTLFEYNPEVRLSSHKSGKVYNLYISNEKVYSKIISLDRSRDKSVLHLRETCCKRSYIRGVFAICGTIINPQKYYTVECIFRKEENAKDFSNLLEPFEIFGRIISRKKYYVFYLKDSEQIAQFLKVLGVHSSLISFEELRVMRDFRNNVNRKVNCETANLNKTIKASVKQTKDIEYIIGTVGLDYLEDNLKEVALIRIENPYMNLSDIGQMLENKLSKSGVNHRLKKISSIAEELRK